MDRTIGVVTDGGAAKAGGLLEGGANGEVVANEGVEENGKTVDVGPTLDGVGVVGGNRPDVDIAGID